MADQYQEFRVIYEFTSAIVCFILVWFMAKPYRYTKQGRYVGLPLAFGLLGASYFFSALTYAQPYSFPDDLLWVQLVTRIFSFFFLALTYRFPKRISETNQLVGGVTVSAIVIGIVTLVVAVVLVPEFNFQNYLGASSFARIFIVICLTYVIIHVLRSHMAKPDPTTLLIPLGYILLAISQYSLIIWALGDSRDLAGWWGALGLRWAGLAVFLYVAYITFFGSQKRADK
jgi:hypothetical protein